jgi:hypothetical protein
LPFRNRGLRNEPAEDHLPGRIDPMPRQGGNYVPPDPLLERIQIRRRLRTTPTRDQRHYGKLSGGFAGHLNGYPLDLFGDSTPFAFYAVCNDDCALNRPLAWKFKGFSRRRGYPTNLINI